MSFQAMMIGAIYIAIFGFVIYVAVRAAVLAALRDHERDKHPS
jgi:hypothetical protein